MMLASTSVHVVEQAPRNGCCQVLCAQGELQLPPVSLGGFSRSAGGSDLGSFQITASGYKINSQGFPGSAVVENLPANAGDTGSSPGLGRSHMPWSN